MFFLLILLLSYLSCTREPAEKRAKHMKRGDAYFENQEFKKAIIEYKNAIQAEPRFAQGHYQLALAYLKTAQPRQAFAEFSRTVDLDPENLDLKIWTLSSSWVSFILLQKRRKRPATRPP
jgi:Tfp pilus assembly protein PilF